MQFVLDPEKALEALLYAATQTPGNDMYKALKVLYVADKLHLSRYGRFIYGETYARLPYGPVPQVAYDIARSVKEPWRHTPFGHDKVLEVLDRDHTTLIPKRAPDLMALSESDIECLDEAIGELRNDSFENVKGKTHDTAWERTPPSGHISIEHIIETLPPERQQAVRDYLAAF